MDQVGQDVPKFSSGYTIEGIILLPYAEIKEPFTAYYDAVNGRSRVDYYGDLVLTVQRGDIEEDDVNGINYKVAWMVDAKGSPERVCFQVNGSSENPVNPQNVIPDISDFKFAGLDGCPDWNGDMNRDLICEKYEKTIKVHGEREQIRILAEARTKRFTDSCSLLDEGVQHTDGFSLR